MSPDKASEERLSFFRWLVIIGLVNFVVLAVLAVGLTANFNSTTNELEEVQGRQQLLAAKLRVSNIASCERGSVVVAREVIDAGQNAKDPVERQEAAFNVLAFRDCEATENQGKVVKMTPSEVNDFIYSVAVRMGVEDWDKRDN